MRIGDGGHENGGPVPGGVGVLDGVSFIKNHATIFKPTKESPILLPGFGLKVGICGEQHIHAIIIVQNLPSQRIPLFLSPVIDSDNSRWKPQIELPLPVFQC
jgi:hypothetical protein